VLSQEDQDRMYALQLQEDFSKEEKNRFLQEKIEQEKRDQQKREQEKREQEKLEQQKREHEKREQEWKDEMLATKLNEGKSFEIAEEEVKHLESPFKTGKRKEDDTRENENDGRKKEID